MITTLTTATGISVVKFIFQQLEIGANRTKSWKKQEIDRSHKNTIFPSSRFFFKKREESRKRQQKCCLLFNILRKRKKEAAIPPFFPDQTKTTKKEDWAEKKLSSFFAIGDVPRSSFLLSGTNIEEFAKVCEIYIVAQKWQHRHYSSWSWDSAHTHPWCICS